MFQQSRKCASECYILARAGVLLAQIGRGEAFNTPRWRSIELEHNHLVRALLQPRPRQIQRVLRPNVPEPAQRVAIDPELPLAELAGVQKRVARLLHLERPTIEARSAAGGLPEPHARRVRHRQRIDPPTGHGIAVDGDKLPKALALAAQLLRVVDAARVLHQDVEMQSEEHTSEL